MKHRLPTLALALLLPWLSGATVYRWTENGVVNYGEQPPAGVTATRVDARGPGVSTPVAAPPTGTPPAGADAAPAATAPDSIPSPSEAAAKAEFEAVRAKACSEARAQLTLLTVPAPRIRVTDPDGTARIMPDDERQQRIAETQASIKELCTPQS